MAIDADTLRSMVTSATGYIVSNRDYLVDHLQCTSGTLEALATFLRNNEGANREAAQLGVAVEIVDTVIMDLTENHDGKWLRNGTGGCC